MKMWMFAQLCAKYWAPYDICIVLTLYPFMSILL